MNLASGIGTNVPGNNPAAGAADLTDAAISRSPASGFNGADHFDRSFDRFETAYRDLPLESSAIRLKTLTDVLAKTFPEFDRDSFAVTTRSFASGQPDARVVELLAEARAVMDRLSDGLDEILERQVVMNPELVREMVHATVPPGRSFLGRLSANLSATFIDLSEGDTLVDQFQSAFQSSGASSAERAKLAVQLLCNEGLPAPV